MPDLFTSHPPATSHTPVAPSVSLHPSAKRFNPFSAFMYMPSGVTFETQQSDETIYLLLRKHWITNLEWVVIGAFLVVAPFFLFPALVIWGILPVEIPQAYLQFLFLSWYLITLSYIFGNFLLWYFTVSIVTQERIIDIDFINLLNKKFAETRIVKVEDVTMRTGGFIKAFFDYGDVLVQTAAKEQEFQFFSVPKPEYVVRVINSLMEKQEEEGGEHE